MSETKVIVNNKLDTPNGLGVDWIANNIYWTDNEYKVSDILFVFYDVLKTIFLTCYTRSR